MTARETEIIKIIKDDPMISQSDIAKMLGITRSSVSVYINNMTKKGILKGRGYIVNDDDYPLIIGSINLDIIGIDSEYRDGFDQGTKGVIENAGIRVSYGGIGKNIAENLVRLDCKPKVISAVASDVFGIDMLKECRNHGIDVDSSQVLKDTSPSATLEIRNKSEDKIITELRSTNISSNLTAEFLKTQHSIINNANQIMIEDKLSREVIEYITASFRNTPLFFFATTYSMTEKYKDLLSRFSTLLIPLDIASILIGDNEVEDTEDISDEAIIKKTSDIIKLGANSVVIPFGKDKICYGDRSEIIIFSSGWEQDKLFGYTFYRDTFMAGLIYCSSQNYTTKETLKFLAACREIATESSSFVNLNMCLDLVQAKVGDIKSKISYHKVKL